MRYLKFVILGCALAGGIGIVALPFVEMNGFKVYALDVPTHGPILLGCFILPALLALFSILRGTARWAMALSLVGFTIAGIKSAGDAGAIGDTPGQTVALITAFVGLLLSLVLLVKPDRRVVRQ
jgi:hypothetical protein